MMMRFYCLGVLVSFFFFFQAEDGIRDHCVTGVQTCALPIFAALLLAASTSSLTTLALAPGALNTGTPRWDIAATAMLLVPAPARPMARTLAATASARRLCERSRIASGADRSGPTRNRAAGKRASPPAAIWLKVNMR